MTASAPQPLASHALQWAGVALAMIGLAFGLAGLAVILSGVAYEATELKVPFFVEHCSAFFNTVHVAEYATLGPALGPTVTPVGVGVLHVGLVLVSFALCVGACEWAGQLDREGKAVAIAAGCTKYDE